MKIGVDFDGVIVNSPQLKAQVARAFYGVTIPANFLKKEAVGAWGLTSAQYQHVQKIVYGTPLGLLAEPLEDAFYYLARLRADGHECIVITARLGRDLFIAKLWAALRRQNLTFIGVGYGVGKAPVATECRLDSYLDDSPEALEPLRGIVPHLFLLSWGHNEAFDGRPLGIHRVASWKDYYETVANLERKGRR